MTHRTLAFSLAFFSTGACSDGGTAPGACPADFATLEARLCFETTAPQGTGSTSTGYYAPSGGDAAVTVAEVGAGQSLPGSAPVDGFDACDAGFERTVRLTDADGYDWIVGWSLTGDLDAPSAAGLAAGADLALSWTYVPGGYSVDWQVVLADGDVPVLFYAYQSYLHDDQVAGLAVGLGTDVCTWTDPVTEETFDELPVVFGADGALTLYTGQSGTIAVDDATLTVAVPFSAALQACDDGCSGSYYVGWK